MNNRPKYIKEWQDELEKNAGKFMESYYILNRLKKLIGTMPATNETDGNTVWLLNTAIMKLNKAAEDLKETLIAISSVRPRMQKAILGYTIEQTENWNNDDWNRIFLNSDCFVPVKPYDNKRPYDVDGDFNRMVCETLFQLERILTQSWHGEEIYPEGCIKDGCLKDYY